MKKRIRRKMDKRGGYKTWREYKDASNVLDEARVITEAQNDILNGMKEGNKHAWKIDTDRHNEDEKNPEAVIDEKIKEEQDQGAEEILKDEIVNALE